MSSVDHGEVMRIAERLTAQNVFLVKVARMRGLLKNKGKDPT